MTSRSIAIIENADAFWLQDRVLTEVDLVVFASGRMSGRLLDWLASSELAACLYLINTVAGSDEKCL